GVDKDLKAAAQWYRKAAEKGHFRAQNNLGRMYLEGRGVKRDYQKAMAWFGKASKGYRYGHFNLGRMYEYGWGVPKDERKADEHFRKFGDYEKEFRKWAKKGNKEAQQMMKKRGLKW
ncbi:tetratricopeptide repeat protein, partial [Thermodesulfobacteriota bacterium]